MADAKHTPEWHLEDGANSHIFDGRVMNGSGSCVAFVHLDTDEGRLIAAAPDLLALALVTIEWSERETEYDGRTYTICNSCSGQDGEHRPGCQIAAFRAAIAKATGAA